MNKRSFFRLEKEKTQRKPILIISISVIIWLAYALILPKITASIESLKAQYAALNVYSKTFDFPVLSNHGMFVFKRDLLTRSNMNLLMFDIIDDYPSISLLSLKKPEEKEDDKENKKSGKKKSDEDEPRYTLTPLSVNTYMQLLPSKSVFIVPYYLHVKGAYLDILSLINDITSQKIPIVLQAVSISAQNYPENESIIEFSFFSKENT